MRKRTTQQQKQAVRRSSKPPQLTIGLDLGDRESCYCLLNRAGDIEQEAKVATQAGALSKKFSSLPRCRIALEAGTHSPWVSRLLENAGHEVIVANPRRIPAITAHSAKHDELDARTLARLARLDPQLLSPLQHRGEAAQLHLLSIRSRATLVSVRSKLINTARSLAKVMGYRLPAAKADTVTPALLDGLPAAIKDKLTPLLEQAASLSQQISELDDQITEISQTHYAHETAKLQQVKGVGPVIALTFVLTLDRAERFSCSRLVGCYLGLRPKRRDSGDSRPQLRITKEGDNYLRALLVQGAHCILGPHGEDSDLRRWGLKLCAVGGKNARKRAIVAVARKLAVLLHRLWIGTEAYDPFYTSKRQRSNAA